MNSKMMNKVFSFLLAFAVAFTTIFTVPAGAATVNPRDAKLKGKIKSMTVRDGDTIIEKNDTVLVPMTGSKELTVSFEDKSESKPATHKVVAKVAKKADKKKATVTVNYDSELNESTITIAAGEKAEEGKAINVTVKSKAKKVKTLKFKVQFVSAVPVTGVTLDKTTPKVGDTITATTVPAQATNIATYKWFSGDTAENCVNEIAGETAASYTVTSDMISKFIKVVVTDTEGTEFPATTTAAVAAKDGTLTASQTNANTIVAVSGSELSATDKIVLKKGSTEQTIEYALSEDKKTVTITTSTKIADDDYTVEITPADTGLAQLTASFKGEAEKLAGLNFGDELALIDNTNFYSVQTTITGANQWGDDYNLASGEVKVYPSVAIATTGAETTSNAWDKTTETNYNAKTKVYTLIKGGSIPFQIGDVVNFTAIYTSGATVIQGTAALTVASVPYVASMEFGELTTTNAKLVGKRVTISNFNKGTYYIPVVAKDQYDNVLDADALNKKVNSNSLFINPTAAQGAYGGFVGVPNTTDGFEKLDDGTIAMKVDGSGTNLPGTATITVAGLGGFSTSTSFTVDDNPYIADLNVVFPGSLYQGTPAEFTIEATDQYGDPVVLYDQKDLEKYTTGNGVYLGDWNTLVKQGSSVTSSNGTITFERNSAKKLLVFKYTPSANANTVNDVITITTAVPQVTTKTLTIGKVGKASSIQKTLDTTKADSALTITSGKDVDFGNALVFVDTNGEVITGKNANIEKPTFATMANLTTLDAVATPAGTHSTTQITVDETHYYYTISTGATPTYETNSKVSNILTSTTYTVSLYEVKGASTATTTDGDGATLKLLDSKDFKVVVTNPNTEGNAYEEYTAEIKEGDELLYNANVESDGTTALNSKILDSATVIVKGTDANNNTATLTAGTDYYLTVDKGLFVDGGDSYKIKPAAGTKVLENGKTAVEGEATITVWDKKSEEKVASVKLAYSNANPVATTWSVTKDAADSTNAGGVEQDTAKDKTAFTGDTVDVPNGAQYAYGTGALKIAVTGGKESYLVECKNQYNTRFLGTGFVAGGQQLNMATGATNVALPNTTANVKKFSFQATASGLDAFDFYAVVDSDADLAAAATLLETWKTANMGKTTGNLTKPDGITFADKSPSETDSNENTVFTDTNGTVATLTSLQNKTDYYLVTAAVNGKSVTMGLKITVNDAGNAYALSEYTGTWS